MRSFCPKTLFVISSLALGLLLALPAGAYTLKTGDQMLRAFMGGSTNFMRYEVVTKDTPSGAFLTGLNYEYALDGPLNVVGSFAPGFADGFIDARVGGGGKYRFTELEMPLVPYGEAQVIMALGIPTRYQQEHINLGLRTALGVDYFVMRQLAVGLELGWEVTGLLTPELAAEMSAEGLFFLGWKF